MTTSIYLSVRRNCWTRKSTTMESKDFFLSQLFNSQNSTWLLHQCNKHDTTAIFGAAQTCPFFTWLSLWQRLCQRPMFSSVYLFCVQQSDLIFGWLQFVPTCRHCVIVPLCHFSLTTHSCLCNRHQRRHRQALPHTWTRRRPAVSHPIIGNLDVLHNHMVLQQCSHKSGCGWNC